MSAGASGGVEVEFDVTESGVLEADEGLGCPKAAPNAPFSEWPLIEDVEIGDVELFGPPDPIMGYVPV